MPNAKETVIALKGRLPDDCSVDDVIYHLYVIRTVERGLEEVAQGLVIPHDEVAESLRSRWSLRS